MRLVARRQELPGGPPMTSDLVPYEKLHRIREQLGLSDADLQVLDPYRNIFVQHRDQFAQHFYDFFQEIPETRLILQHEGRPGFMKKTWAAWFAFVFKTRLDDALLAYLWQVGVRHVQVNLDQRYSNLGFSVIRQFCHQVVSAEIPPDKAAHILNIINKMLDLCLLIETEAYITHTTRCDLEVMREVADRVRNPVTVIGGNIRRMQKKVDAASKEYDLLERLFTQTHRLEGMVRDIKVYMDTFEGEPQWQRVALDKLVDHILEKVRAEEPETRNQVKVELAFDQDALFVTGDPVGLQHLFYYLLQNSFDAAGEDAGYIKISSRVDENEPQTIQVEIFNTGVLPDDEEMERLFTPFYSTKVAGTGFGLPIARLVARKHYGKMDLQFAEGTGAQVHVTLRRA
jgi:nitrogen-specific signal transduction histidine kinase